MAHSDDVTPDDELNSELSKVFAALADPTRRDMVVRLSDGEATLSELAGAYDVSLQAVAKHLKVLEAAGLVTRGREAQRRPVRLEADVLHLTSKWLERHRRRVEERYARLDDVLADLADAETSDAGGHTTPGTTRTGAAS
ncbi:ArsR/SmtB family transcription factor [Nocardioides malaquae]|uniref:ArsR/SmtB family transcription factor n=1 Tax=Nocardioides malaquae TaxID=2773426 RepID=UPI0029D41B73|nr:metalloregulator ArsR/SmtB family transcription factor [Nocardioides malaquae]